MPSAPRGTLTSDAEVTNISAHGFWLLLAGRELFVPFDEFPWFRDAPVGRILNVVLQSSEHLYWPDLDIDLAVETIEHPERFPLVSRVRPDRALQPPRRAQRGRKRRPSPREARG